MILERLVLEAFDKERLNTAVTLIKALQSIDFASVKLPTFAKARDAAIKDVNEILALTSKNGLMKRLVSMFKKPQNPMIDALSFCDATKNFFEGLLQYVEAKKTGVNDAETLTLRSLVVGPTQNDGVLGSPQKDVIDNKKQMQTLQNLIINGFKPDKTIRRLTSRAWLQKYLKNDYAGVATDIMKAKVQDLEKIGKDVIDKFQDASSIVKSLMDVQSMAKTAATQSTATTPPTSSSEPLSTTPSKPSDSPSNQGTNAKNVAVKTAKEIYSQMHDKFGDIPEETVLKIISMLAYNDMIKQ